MRILRMPIAILNCRGRLYSLGHKDLWFRRGVGTLVRGGTLPDRIYYFCGLVYRKRLSGIWPILSLGILAHLKVENNTFQLSI
jgi:hypothetical protein